jgi:ketosteroid isomerase-like protein
MTTYGDQTTADRVAVEGLLEQYKDAWFRQDTDAFIALHAEDTEWINAYAHYLGERSQVHACAI